MEYHTQVPNIIRNTYRYFKMNEILEILAVMFNLVYLMLLIKERIECWFFGIAGSLLSIYIFYSIQLYSESVLYIYYVVIGIYGYLLWRKNSAEKDTMAVQKLSMIAHLFIVIGGCTAALLLGYYFSEYSDAVNPYLDASTTVFSLIASFMEAKKILSAWWFWVVINVATILLYFQQELDYYLGLTVVYFVFSWVGYFKWKKSFDLAALSQVNS